MSTAVAMTDCILLRIERQEMLRVIRDEPIFADFFVAYMLDRNNRMQQDFIDQLFNSSEKRLARTLLLLANFDKGDRPEAVIPKISQETLAEMVGTTRSRVNLFMNRFRKQGFIQYNGSIIQIYRSLWNIVLDDENRGRLQDEHLPAI